MLPVLYFTLSFLLHTLNVFEFTYFPSLLTVVGILVIQALQLHRVMLINWIGGHIMWNWFRTPSSSKWLALLFYVLVIYQILPDCWEQLVDWQHWEESCSAMVVPVISWGLLSRLGWLVLVFPLWPVLHRKYVGMNSSELVRDFLSSCMIGFTHSTFLILYCATSLVKGWSSPPGLSDLDHVMMGISMLYFFTDTATCLRLGALGYIPHHIVSLVAWGYFYVYSASTSPALLYQLVLVGEITNPLYQGICALECGTPPSKARLGAHSLGFLKPIYWTLWVGLRFVLIWWIVYQWWGPEMSWPLLTILTMFWAGSLDWTVDHRHWFF